FTNLIPQQQRTEREKLAEINEQLAYYAEVMKSKDYLRDLAQLMSTQAQQPHTPKRKNPSSPEVSTGTNGRPPYRQQFKFSRTVSSSETSLKIVFTETTISESQRKSCWNCFRRGRSQGATDIEDNETGTEATHPKEQVPQTVDRTPPDGNLGEPVTDQSTQTEDDGNLAEGTKGKDQKKSCWNCCRRRNSSPGATGIEDNETDMDTTRPKQQDQKKSCWNCCRRRNSSPGATRTEDDETDTDTTRPKQQTAQPENPTPPGEISRGAGTEQ
ncbi:hypothetical protein BaRGS_00006159, partial [Batillaria attramentaria]